MFSLLTILETILLLLGPISFLEGYLRGPAPYGRYLRSVSSTKKPPPKCIRSDLGWILMESPAFLTMFIPTITTLLDYKSFVRRNDLLLAVLFCAHYFNRCVLYPLRMKAGKMKRMSLQPMIYGMIFCGINGYVNAEYLLGDGGNRVSGGLLYWVGVLGWVVGFGINWWADGVLRDLREKDGEYVVPRGGLFEWVSCANYFGEIVEWCGWCLACGGSKGSLAFVGVTVGNLGMRAWYHHEWYLRKFEGYENLGRKRLVPLVF